MAGLKCSLSSSSVSTGTTIKTVLSLVAGSGAGLIVRRIKFDPAGISPTDAKGLLELVKSGSGGTGTSKTPTKMDGHTGSVVATGKEDFSSNPTGGTVIYSGLVHAQGEFQLQPNIVLNPSEMLEMRVTFSVSVASRSSILFEE